MTIRDVTPLSIRTRRSASAPGMTDTTTSGMPEHLHLDLHSDLVGKNTGVSLPSSLRLRRSNHISIGRLPVYTVGDDQKMVEAQLPEDTVRGRGEEGERGGREGRKIEEGEGRKRREGEERRGRGGGERGREEGENHLRIGRLPVYTVGDDQKMVEAQLPEDTVRERRGGRGRGRGGGRKEGREEAWAGRREGITSA